ncbi:MAG: hypothetical protein DCC55_24640 [Chloroflexi bacterium]|nr:MAG: hypothetical protein DCC55_24640 [Chloroflexota bacterium]
MSQLNLYLLGVPRIELNNRPVALSRRKLMALLAYLLVSRQPQRRDTLATLLWPELGQMPARAALRRELHTLTSTIGQDWLYITRDEIGRKATAPIWVDVEQFQQLAAHWHTHHHTDGILCRQCIDALTEAAALYRDDFLTGLTLAGCSDFDEWRAFQAERLRRTFAGLIDKLVQTHEQLGAYETAIQLARRRLAADNTDEPIHRDLMRLYALAGQPAAALRQYEECVHMLDAELGIAPADETVALYTAIRTRRFPGNVTEAKNARLTSDHPVTLSSDQPVTPSPSDPILPSPAAKRHNLPVQGTPFFGRQDEVDAIRQLLMGRAECRLLTLIGPGGIGKTRLSLQVAQTQIEDDQTRLADGVYFVPLAAVVDKADLVGAIANAVSCVFHGRDEPQTQLEHFLRPKKLLLVVDNFEHLLDGAQLLPALLKSAPELLLLVTSREALELPEEWLYPLGGLTPPSGVETLAEFNTNAAVQLFVQRARQVDARFALSAQNATHVVRICQLVDGMPLGLELAAAWVGTLNVDEIADEIASNIDILASDLRNIPERHRSLRAVFEQTWARLTAGEQRMLRRLAIFRGAFTREAAQQVAGVSLLDISSLVDKSLCHRYTGRFGIHELLRQFAFEHLDEDEKSALFAQHSRYFGELLASHQPSIMTAAEGAMVRTIADEFDNILAGWRYLLNTIQQKGATEESDRLLGGYVPVLAAYFDRRSLFWEGRRLFEAAISILNEAPSKRTAENGATYEALLQLQIERAGMGMHLGRYQEAKEILLALLPVLRTGTNRRQLADALTYLGPAQMRLGEYVEVERYLEEAVHIYEQLGLRLASTWPVINLGLVKSLREQFDEARAYYQKAVEIYEEVGYATGLARCLSNIGSTYVGAVNVNQAVGYYERAYEYAKESNNRLWLGIILNNLAECAYKRGAYHESKEQYAKSLVLFRELNEMRWVTISLADASFPLIALDDLETVAGNLRESLQVAQQYQLVAEGVQALAATALLLHRRGQLAPAVAVATHVLADARSRSEARNYCQKELYTLAGEMPEADYAAAQFRGNSTPFGLMVQSALESLEME